MVQLLISPNIIWKIANLSEIDEQFTNFHFLGMEWILAVVRHPKYCFSNNDVIQLTLERLSPILDTEAEELVFSVFTTMTVDYMYSLDSGPEHIEVSRRKWCLMSLKVEKIREVAKSFKFDSEITFSISCTFHNTMLNLKKLEHFKEHQKPNVSLSQSSLLDDLNKLLTDGMHSDAVLNCRGEIFNVHKTILSARSVVFEAMFRNNMKEREEGIVDIPDIEPNIMKQFLHYVYSGKLWGLSLNSACKLFAVADKYAVDALKIECSLFIAKAYAEEIKETKDSKETEETEVNTSAAGNVIDRQPFSIKRKLLKMLFKSLEWKILASKSPKLASEICTPNLIKDP